MAGAAARRGCRAEPAILAAPGRARAAILPGHAFRAAPWSPPTPSDDARAAPPAPSADAAPLRRNVRLYPWFAAATSVSPWLPIFFLFFDDRVGFDGALTLSGIYYAAVVALEVPSGYLSDRVGRRAVLLVASASSLAAFLGFALADGFAALAACQVLLAAGVASQSGSDSALLYDSMLAGDDTDGYGAAEARARTFSMVALGASCVAGGLLGAVSLRLPYVLAALGALVALALAARFVEPPVEGAGTVTLADQGRALGRAFGEPVLRWLLAWYVLAFTLAHVPFELYQPWIRLLGEAGAGAWLAGGERAPVVSGIVAALSMFGGAVGAAVSIRVAGRLGLSRLLLAANLVQLGIVGGLAIALHPALLVLVFSRNFAMNMTHGPTMAAIAPRLASAQRATWLSLQSLAGRLGFSFVVFAFANGVGDALDWATLRGALLAALGAGAVLTAAVWAMGRGPAARVATVAP